MDVLASLNAQQRRAVESPDGPLLIVAGPGTGKTKTLTARIACLLARKQVAPGDILALTFTNKSARALHERVAALLNDAPAPLVTTFHALAHRLLQPQGDRVLIDEAARMQLIRDVPKPAALKSVAVRELSLLISRAKTALQPLADTSTATLLARYNQALGQRQARDFDDLLREAYDLLQKPGATHYDYVLVDEFQDTSELQYELLRSLCPTGNVFAIGDPNQSIYAFRGAGADMFNSFHKDFPQAQTVTLTTNYRSAPEIVHLANAIFPTTTPLVPYRANSGTARAVQTLNEFTEAAYILNEIESGIGGSDLLKATSAAAPRQLCDYAVLYRTHRAATAVRRQLAESGIPFQVAGEGSPYEQPAVQALIALLRWLSTQDEAARQALPQQSALKHWTLAQCDAALAKLPPLHSLAVSELAAQLVTLFNLNDADVRQFTGSLVQFGTCQHGLATCLAHIDAIAEQEFYDSTVNAVTLLTIHAAKGLEFDHVFLCATEDGILPKLRKAVINNVEEERRLFYVASTRARHQLDIMYTKQRGGEPATLSRFVQELSPEIVPRITDPNMAAHQKRAAKRRQKRAQTKLF
jgi:DNA helicase II / ATP-dependent DNA helicase PcrA